MEPKFTSGRESWVFRAREPAELCGYHPEMIGGALEPDEPVLYMLYSPLFEAQGGFFGHRGPSGSHAVAVTERRFLLSRDPHQEGRARSVRAIPFDRILWIEVGQALLLGWLVIRFRSSGAVASETVFFSSPGLPHFQAAVRAFRQGREEAASAALMSPTWHEASRLAPPYLRSELAPLVLGGERPLAVLGCAERWGRERRGWRERPLCISPTGLGVLTDRSFLWLESERPGRPGALVFGVNAAVVDRAVLRAARLGVRSEAGVSVRSLALDVGKEGVTTRLEVPFDEEWAAQAEAIAQVLGERAATVP